MIESGAFLPGPRLRIPGSATGPLAGLTFAAKDLFDVAGLVTGCGNPDWALSHAPAARTAWCIERLLEAGATLVGKTVTDEISLGLLGSNRFFGVPVNPHAPDRYPGGSSSGSAVAVAAGEADFALGSDSGGSVRVPASFLGLYGLRPTHGAIPVDGLMTQSASFDTVGFFAANAEIFRRVGSVLLPEAPEGEEPPTTLLLASDALAICDEEVRAAAEPALARVAARIGPHRSISLAAEGLRHWNGQHCALQHPEYCETFAPWLDAVNPRLSFEVARALSLGRLVPAPRRDAARAFRIEVRARIEALLAGGALLCFPTAPVLPPRLSASLTEVGTAVERIVDLTCIAGLSGLPQVSLPLAQCHGLPLGLSLLGPRHSDLRLIDWACRLADLAA